MRVLVVIPAYNEEESIVRVVENLKQNYEQLDYVIINDGSKDHTAQICRENGYQLVNLPTNLGLAGAVQAGMKYALCHGYNATIQFDADGQHRPEYIRPMLNLLNEGYDIVIGSRFVMEKKPTTLRMLGSFLLTSAIYLTTGKKITDPTSGMRMYNRRMIEELATQINCAPEPDTVSYFIRRGAKVGEIQVTMDERIAGARYLNLTRSMGYMLRMGISILILQWFRKGPRFDEREGA